MERGNFFRPRHIFYLRWQHPLCVFSWPCLIREVCPRSLGYVVSHIGKLFTEESTLHFSSGVRWWLLHPLVPAPTSLEYRLFGRLIRLDKRGGMSSPVYMSRGYFLNVVYYTGGRGKKWIFFFFHLNRMLIRPSRILLLLTACSGRVTSRHATQSAQRVEPFLSSSSFVLLTSTPYYFTFQLFPCLVKKDKKLGYRYCFEINK